MVFFNELKYSIVTNEEILEAIMNMKISVDALVVSIGGVKRELAAGVAVGYNTLDVVKEFEQTMERIGTKTSDPKGSLSMSEQVCT